MDPVVKPRGDT
ncbi:MAG TPA: hypothetical protein LFW20_03600 [Rickettsia endosymbiont of Omalisus fontisbellaquei]|nr:hypothetical protein [Rickettsia endosymbiont of Omalisus fontisbellaquei]HJD59742.1 hypothetical protein [Rickettsia endosymbiont of Omalisus fontisbellaquei]